MKPMARRTLINTAEKNGVAWRDIAIVDVGCSVGISTRYISDAFPTARMIGMDLSPYMLAVAKRADEGKPGGEDTKMEDGSVDVVSLAFVIHECPEYATRALLTEAARILKPGGTFVMTDNNPKSAVIQNLPPALFTLMKSTEPHSNEYYTIDIEGMLTEIGFEHVHTEQTDPRHRTVLASKPKK
ncbi:uncharacterized protein MICPUCDRAFT_24606 [Micromonas pusilla CCMP1545]|uniref:Predicted protein n=1 Tax=Micromonas pusilla (strain CCMP1545) TaxID=564608 RepID=C1MJF9_MICPC|nr:uncharacterized protein MICPUCDRAFT_24606 [Micromonas pusilla CCMP1545]EEH60559.1 predicted protein [Micromonas pusilla CCMP1545]|eukprot:XP_003055307.1 predicted protein [Micromonas pusilla CCMP1545]